MPTRRWRPRRHPESMPTHHGVSSQGLISAEQWPEFLFAQLLQAPKGGSGIMLANQLVSSDEQAHSRSNSEARRLRVAQERSDVRTREVRERLAQVPQIQRRAPTMRSPAAPGRRWSAKRQRTCDSNCQCSQRVDCATAFGAVPVYTLISGGLWPYIVYRKKHTQTQTQG